MVTHIQLDNRRTKMNKTQALKTLNHYGKERRVANTGGTDWQPSRETYREIREATAMLDGEWPKTLTAAGRELYEYQHMFNA
jgi:hypothetical protein